MTPREALFILDDENKCSKRDIEAFTVLKDFITATEHVPTLEKLGYKLDKVLHEKGGTIWEYVNNLDYCISISKENGKSTIISS